MGFTATPISSSCNAFVAHLAELMQSKEIRKRKRTAAAQARFEEGFGTILAHLLLADFVHPRKWSYRETAAGGFSGAAVGYGPSPRSRHSWNVTGLSSGIGAAISPITLLTGQTSLFPGWPPLRGTLALVELAETFGVDFCDVRAHVSDAMPRM